MSKKHHKQLRRKKKRKQVRANKNAKKAYVKDLIKDIYDKRTATLLNFVVDQGYKHHEGNIFKVGNRVFELKRLRTSSQVLEALGDDAKKMNALYGLEPKNGEGGIVIQIVMDPSQKLIEFDCRIVDVQALQKKLQQNTVKKEPEIHTIKVGSTKGFSGLMEDGSKKEVKIREEDYIVEEVISDTEMRISKKILSNPEKNDKTI